MRNSIESIRGTATKGQLLEFAYRCTSQVDTLNTVA
jgi:hypothetical protein